MAYLTDVLARLPQATNHNVHRLTPANWAKENRPHLQRAAWATPLCRSNP